ncbi:MAG: hypothetical protein HY364_03870 [Candidatus Aenigmarchaeota archaeon]|nr:hypothetical protein [Candidatus Aenigmarchaeota archaeon]
MLFSKAVKIAGESEKTKRLENYFLGSLFASVHESIGEWTLHFYNPKTHTTVNCTVHENGTVEVEAETPALSKLEKLDIATVKISPEKAVQIAVADYSMPPVQTLLTLAMKAGVPVWTVSIISSALSVNSYDVSAEEGVLKEKRIATIMQRFNSLERN